MITYKTTNIMTSRAQVIVNTVNCVGVMGKGLAAAMRAHAPDMFAAYKRACDQGLLEPGKLMLWRGSRPWILNFPTKDHWKLPSQIHWIEAGLQKFVETYEDRGIADIAFPPLGCGNGGLRWADVHPLMARYLEPLPISVAIHCYEPPP